MSEISDQAQAVKQYYNDKYNELEERNNRMYEFAIDVFEFFIGKNLLHEIAKDDFESMEKLLSEMNKEDYDVVPVFEYRQLERELAEKDRLIEQMREALKSLRQKHVICEDGWYSCPASGECYRDDAGDECDCGADTANKIIEAALEAAERAGG